MNGRDLTPLSHRRGDWVGKVPTLILSDVGIRIARAKLPDGLPLNRQRYLERSREVETAPKTCVQTQEG